MKRRKRVWNRLVVSLVMASMVMSMCMTAFAEEETRPEIDVVKTEADVLADVEEADPGQTAAGGAGGEDCEASEHEEGCPKTKQAENEPECTGTEDCEAAEHEEGCPKSEPAESESECTRTEDCEAAEHEEGCPKSEPVESEPECTGTEDCEAAEHEEGCPKSEPVESESECTGTEDCEATEHEEGCPKAEQAENEPECTRTEDCEASKHEEGCPKSETQRQDVTDTEDTESEPAAESPDGLPGPEAEILALSDAMPLIEESEPEMTGRVRIGSTGYETLKAALDAAEAGDKVILQEDIELNGSGDRMSFEGKDLTLDLCGHAIRLTDPDYYAMSFYESRIEIKDSSDEQSGRIFNEDGGYTLIRVDGSSTFSMTGGTLENNTEGCYALNVNYRSSADISGTARIVNTAAKGTALEIANSKAEVFGDSRIENTGAGGKAVDIWTSSEFVLSENGMIIQEDADGAAGIVADNALGNMMAQIRITGGTLRSASAGISVGGASAEVTGGTIETAGSIFVDIKGQAGLNGMKKIHISGGTFKAPTFVVQGESNAKCDISLAGGTYQGGMKKEELEPYIQSGAFELQDSAEGQGAFTVTVPAEGEAEGNLRIGSTGYETLKAALNAARPGDKVVLQKDIVVDGSDRMFFEDKDLTLDLCGHAIRLTDPDYYAMNFWNSRITIRDSSDEQSGRIFNEAGGYTLIKVDSSSTFSMTGGTLENNTEGCYALNVNYRSSAGISGTARIVNTAAKGTALEIANSKAEVSGDSQIKNTGAGGKTVDIWTSSEFILSENGAVIQEDTAGAAGIVADNALGNMMAQIRIAGGTLQSKSAGISVGGASAEVTGGTIEAAGSIFVDTTGQAGLNGMKKIHISGGTFKAPTFVVQGTQDAKCTISITGGTYQGGMEEAELATHVQQGYEIRDSWEEPGTLIVGVSETGTPVVRIKDRGYASLAEAIAAAADGDRIVLLSDLNLTKSISVDKKVTLDLGGYTMTAENPLIVEQGGSLTIADSPTAEGTEGRIVNTETEGTSPLIWVLGKLELTGGTLENVSSNGAVLASNRSGSTIRLSGGKVVSAAVGIRAKSAQVTITGGELDAGSHALQTGHAVIAEDAVVKAGLAIFSLPEGASNEITGGRFQAPALTTESEVSDSLGVVVRGGIFAKGIDTEQLGKYVESGMELTETEMGWTLQKKENPDPENPDPEKPDPEEPDPEKPDPENPDPEKPDPEDPNPEKPNPEKPAPEKPEPEKPDPEKPLPTEPGTDISKPENPGSVNPSPTEPGENSPKPEQTEPSSPAKSSSGGHRRNDDSENTATAGNPPAQTVPATEAPVQNVQTASLLRTTPVQEEAAGQTEQMDAVIEEEIPAVEEEPEAAAEETEPETEDFVEAEDDDIPLSAAQTKTSVGTVVWIMVLLLLLAGIILFLIAKRKRSDNE